MNEILSKAHHIPIRKLEILWVSNHFLLLMNDILSLLNETLSLQIDFSLPINGSISEPNNDGWLLPVEPMG